MLKPLEMVNRFSSRTMSMRAAIATLALVAVAISSLSCTPPRLAELPPQPATIADLKDSVPESAPELLGDPFLYGGEFALYELRFRGVAIADLEVSVGQRGTRGGLPTYAARARAEMSGVLEVAVSGFWEMTAELQFGAGDRPNREAKESWSIRYGTERSTRERHHEFRDNEHSFLSAIGVLRAWAPRTGDVASLRIDLHAPFTLVMAAIEENDRGVFSRPSVRVVGRAGHSRYGFPFEFWISRDRDRIPLLVRAMSKFGRVELELLGYRRSSN